MVRENQSTEHQDQYSGFGIYILVVRLQVIPFVFPNLICFPRIYVLLLKKFDGPSSPTRSLSGDQDSGHYSQ